MNDDEFGDDNASGIEGGKVGQEIPAEEMAHESHAQENSAPEEQADQAKPISYNSSQNNESWESKKTWMMIKKKKICKIFLFLQKYGIKKQKKVNFFS